MCPACCEEVVAFRCQHLGGIQHGHFLFRCTRREQNILFRDTETDGKHTFQNSLGNIVTDTPDLARRSHIDTQNGIGLLQAVEGELGSFDTYIIQIEFVLIRFLDR